MKLFEYKRIGNKINAKVFGIKISFHFPPKKNHYISLGTNCFVRMVLTKFHLKAFRKDGELSCPFDLCTTPIVSLAEILENDFSDFFDEVEVKPNGENFINKKYSIDFPHEENLTLNDFITRYKKRIKNFRSISQEKSLKKYVLTCEQSSFTVEQLNRIYNSLSKIRNGKPFKFYVLNFIYENLHKADLEGLNPQIFYYEFDITDEHKNGWLGNFGWLAQNINPEILKNV